jgi:hypothetical protein
MRVRLLIVLPMLGLLPACAVERPIKDALHMSKPKAATTPTKTFPAPPSTPSSVNN